MEPEFNIEHLRKQDTKFPWDTTNTYFMNFPYYLSTIEQELGVVGSLKIIRIKENYSNVK